MKMVVIGLGLMGGSAALELKASGFAKWVIGVDSNEEHSRQALNLGLVDDVLSLIEAVKCADGIIIATPVGKISELLPKVLEWMPDHAFVTDMGSTKLEICKSVEGHKKRKRYVPSHPMAGTEFSGPGAAHLGLFHRKAAVICDVEQSDPDAAQKVNELYQALQMRIVFMHSNEHDLHAAYVSHLSHISSFILANTVLDKEKNVDAIFNLASGGFESTVRLAKSSPAMWNPIFEQNQKYIVEALGEYIERLRIFHQNLIEGKYHETLGAIQQANEIRRVLAQIGTKKGTHEKA